MFLLFFPFSFFFILHTNYSIQCGCSDRSDRTMCVSYTWKLPKRKLNIIASMASCLSHMRSFFICAFSSPLYASIWLKMWPCWVAWLLYLCPTFPLIQLGHKGSTSVIVTAGWAGCVPQTGWSRKLAFLREYSVGGQKMFFFVYYNVNPQKFFILHLCSQCGHVHWCMRTQGKDPITERFSLEDFSYIM